MKKCSSLVTALFMALFLFSAMTPASSAVVYTVKAKDTLWKIARNNNTSIDAILKANPELSDEKSLKTGMAIMIPDQEDEIIPLENEASETTTLILHGSGSQYQTSLEKDVNVMTINGRKVRVPANRKSHAIERKSYKSKFHNMSSRGFLPGSAIVRSAFKYMGSPYVFGGTTPSGFDCSGFIQYVFRENGISTPRMAHHQYYAGIPIRKSQLRPGDLVFFETYTKGISHVGIYIGNSNFIHASSRGAVRVNSLSEQYYTDRYRGSARYVR